MTKFSIILGVTVLFVLCVFAIDKKNTPDAETAENWRRNSKNWKLWMFYYNPDDKRMLPPKRMKGLGWTINFGNPYSIIIMLLFIALVTALEYMLSTYHR